MNLKNIMVSALLILSNGIYAKDIKYNENSIFNLKSEWVTHLNETVGLEHLKNKLSIVAMVYTSCEHTCPMIIAKLSRIKKSLAKSDQDKITMVLISFDPKRDTAANLAKYKTKRGLDESWILMTGKEYGIRNLAAILGVSFKEESEGNFSHSNIITLIDGEGVIKYQLNDLSEDHTAMKIEIEKGLKK